MNCIKQKTDVLWNLPNTYTFFDKLLLVAVFLQHEIVISVTC